MEKESHNGDMTPEEYQNELKSMKDMDAQDAQREIITDETDFDDHDDVLRNEPFDDGSEIDIEGTAKETVESDWNDYNSAVSPL